MRINRATLCVACASVLGFTGAACAEPYSKAVQHACGADYHKFCGDYGLETSALRVCMDKVGNNLSPACVHALIASGEVSQAEVNRRKADR